MLFQEGFQRCQIFFPGRSDVKRMNAARVSLVLFIRTAPGIFQIIDTARAHQRRDDAEPAGLPNFFFLLFFRENEQMVMGVNPAKHLIFLWQDAAVL